jgi:hypothetical protein
MVNFAQSFLQNLANPAMSRSLFGAGAAIGSIPGQLQQQKRLENYRQMDPLERLNYDIANAKTREDIQKATAAKDSFVKQEALKAISKLEAARASTDDPDLQRRYEESMAGIAARSGLDSKGYIGRTDAEELRVLQRKSLEDAARVKEITQQEKGVSRAFRSLLASGADEATIEQAKKKWSDAGFTQVIQTVEQQAIESANRELRHTQLTQAAADRDTYLSNTSPVEELEADINANTIIGKEVKAVLKERIKRLKDDYPDFANKGTWTEAGRRQHDAAYRSIDTAYYNAVTDAVTAQDRQQKRMVNLRESLIGIAAKQPAANIWKNYTKIAEDQLREEKDTNLPRRIDGIDEQQINRRAVELAKKAMQEETLAAHNAVLTAQGLPPVTLEEVLGTTNNEQPPSTSGKAVESEETIDFSKADKIAGF